MTLTIPVPFQYNAWIIDWHDADTFLAKVDRGDRDYSTWSIRGLGYAARELADPGGPDALTECATRWPPGTQIVLATVKPDKWRDRKDARVTVPTDHGPADLATLLIAEGWALPWNGRGKQPKPPWPRTTA